MLVIFTANETSRWEIGQKKPHLDNKEINAVYADEKELTYILTHFSNIPFRLRSEAMTWYGDMAKFITGNL